MKPIFVLRCALPFFALLGACGGAAEMPDAPGADANNVNTDSGSMGGGDLQPGEAGTGHLAYIVAPGDQLEITNLTTGRVEYRSREEDGQVQRFFLSADGTTAVFHTAVSPCTRVSLPSGATSSCTPEGIVAALPIGISNDGARIAFTGLRLSGGSAGGQAVGSILEGTTLTDVATGDTNSVLTGCGAISPNGDAVYTFGYDRSVSENPPLSLTRHTVGGAPEVIFDVADGVTAFNITDVILQLSEDGTRGLFPCSDPSQSVPAERVATCSVDLTTGTVVRYSNAVGSMSLDGSTVITVPFIGENFSVYPFGNSTPSSVVMPGREGNAPTLSPDASRIGFRIRTDDAFRVAATRPIGGGANVLVQRNGEGGAATAAGMRWSR